MSAGDEVCTGWLVKSPPEKKLKRYAWRKRWFVLRCGRMSGNPDVLEYYRGRSSRKPIRSIDLRDSQVQVQTDMRHVRSEFQDQHLFVVKTVSRVYYLVAKTEEEMNSWVGHISQICHFTTLDDETELVDHFSPIPPSQQPSPASSVRASRTRIASQDLTVDVSTTEDSRSESESSQPSDYLILSQCETGRVNVHRCDSCSNSERSLEQNSSDNPVEDVFLSPSCSTQALSPLELDLSAASSSTPQERAYHIPSPAPLPRHPLHPMLDVFQFERAACSPDQSVPPPRPCKLSHFSERCMDEGLHGAALRGGGALFTDRPILIPRRISLAGLDHIQRGEFDTSSERSWNKRHSLNLPHLHAVTSPSSVDCYEESYIPMRSGASSPACAFDSAADGYVPMSPASVKFLLPSDKPDTPPPAATLHELPRDLEPPPVNRDLKPSRKGRPPPLDLRGLSTIRECPLHPPLGRTLTEPWSSPHCFSLERCAQAGSSPADKEDGCPEIESSQLSFSSNESPPHFPRKSNLDYLLLDFNSALPSPVQKKALLAEEQRVDYVQVDKKKTQALQNTLMDWKDFRQSIQSVKQAGSNSDDKTPMV